MFEQVLRDLLGDIYYVQSVVAGPEDMGWWVNRRRRFCILTLKDSEYTTILQPKDFLNAFGRSRSRAATCMRGDMFYCAPLDAVATEAQRHVKRRRCAQDVGLVGGRLAGQTVLCDGNQARCAIYERNFVDKLMGSGMAACLLASGFDLSMICQRLCNEANMAFICDLEQHSAYGNMSLSSAMPTLISHGCYFSFRLQRQLLPMEHFVCQGFPLFGLGSYSTPWGSAIEKMSPSAIRDLAGNSMHLEVMWALMLWILASTVKTFGQVPRSLPSRVDSPEANDDSKEGSKQEARI